MFKYPKHINVKGLKITFKQLVNHEDWQVAWYKANSSSLPMEIWVFEDKWATVFFDRDNGDSNAKGEVILPINKQLQIKILPKKLLIKRRITEYKQILNFLSLMVKHQLSAFIIKSLGKNICCIANN